MTAPLAFVVCSVAAFLLLLVTLPGAYSYRWESNPSVHRIQAWLLGFMFAGFIIGMIGLL